MTQLVHVCLRNNVTMIQLEILQAFIIYITINLNFCFSEKEDRKLLGRERQKYKSSKRCLCKVLNENHLFAEHKRKNWLILASQDTEKIITF